MVNIFDEVKDCKTIGISGHVRPDGDCAGSCLGMALYLKKLLGEGVRVDVFLGDLSDSLRHNLIGQELVHWNYETDVKAYDAFLCLDCEATRLGVRSTGWIRRHQAPVSSATAPWTRRRLTGTSQRISTSES